MSKILEILAIVVASLLLAATLGLLVVEPTWDDDEKELSPEEAFKHGSIGAEIGPLPVMQVLPDLCPDLFQPGGEAAGDWIEQYGFHRDPENTYENLPLGFAVSHYRPKSGAPTPVPFAGFACALCHTARIQTGPDDPGDLIYGMGNFSLDIFAWVDALQGALLDEERVTVDTIAAAYQKRFGEELSVGEKVMIRIWLGGARKGLAEALPKWDDPYPGDKLRNSRYMVNGPSRTQAFRELVRFYMDRPAAKDFSYSKLPPVYHQSNRVWAQNDGSVRSPVTRSVLAALAAGATPTSLVVPGILHDALEAVNFSLDLHGPKWEDVFPEHPIDQEKVARGWVVYERFCDSCHGHPDPSTGEWIKGERQEEVVPAEQIGTDDERVNYRHYMQLTTDLYEAIPDGSPIKPNRDDVRPGPLGNTRGYINAPLESLFTRVPFLHNGSVLTLAEVINLKPRREVFYRGRNFYDPVDVGLITPDQATDRNYYEFDTSTRGNSNAGHDFPWAFQGPGWNEAELVDLLEYLKTL